MARPVFAGAFGPPAGAQKNCFFQSLEGAKSLENQRDLRIAGEKAFGVYDNNQADRSMVSCFFQQSDCGLARLVHVCLLQCLWWTSAVSRPSALTLRIFWSVLVLGETGEGWGDVERRFGAVEPWSLS